MKRTLGEIVYIIVYEIYMWLLQNEEKGKKVYIMEISAFETMWTGHTELVKRKKGEVEPTYIQWKRWAVEVPRLITACEVSSRLKIIFQYHIAMS